MLYEQKKDKKEKVSGGYEFHSSPLAVLAIISGIAACVAGVYFKINDMTSSGLVLSKYGPSTTGTINGTGMIILGAFILLFGLSISIEKKEEK